MCVKVSDVKFDDLVAIKNKNKIIKLPDKLLKNKGWGAGVGGWSDGGIESEGREALWYKTIKG